MGENFQILTSITAREENNSGLYANDSTPLRGLFIRPSDDVPGRPADITGYYLTAQNELGKLEWDLVNAHRVNPRAEATQTGSINNPVTINGRAGVVTTLEVDNLGIASNETFTVVNSFVSSSSIILLSFDMISSDPDQRPLVSVNNVSTGQFDIVITTFSPNMTGSFIIRFVVL